MKFRSVMGGIIALPLLYGAAFAAGTSEPRQSGIQLPGVFVPLPKIWARDNNPVEAPARVAQASDPRVLELQEQVRKLNGTIEELNFQVLQMQEQLRKMQEDNEFRFQELEGKRSDSGGASKKPRKAADAPQQDSGDPVAGAIASAEASPLPDAGAASPGLGLPEKPLGSIVFDQSGNVVGGDVADQAHVGSAPMDSQGPLVPGTAVGGGATSDNTKVAALPPSNDPEEIYRNSYQFILSGDYGTAEAGFRDHIARFPNDPKAADAHFWLGEALLGQKKYRDAAEVFLEANKQFPKAKKAPDMMFKLGVSLVGLKQNDVACATLKEVGKRYPEASAALKERIKQEQTRAAC